MQERESERERESVLCVLHATSCFTLKYPNGHRKSSKCASASWISNLIRLFDSHAHIRRQPGGQTGTHSVVVLCSLSFCLARVRWVLEQHYSCLLSPTLPLLSALPLSPLAHTLAAVACGVAKARKSKAPSCGQLWWLLCKRLCPLHSGVWRSFLIVHWDKQHKQSCCNLCMCVFDVCVCVFLCCICISLHSLLLTPCTTVCDDDRRLKSQSQMQDNKTTVNNNNKLFTRCTHIKTITKQVFTFISWSFLQFCFVFFSFSFESFWVTQVAPVSAAALGRHSLPNGNSIAIAADVAAAVAASASAAAAAVSAAVAIMINCISRKSQSQLEPRLAHPLLGKCRRAPEKKRERESGREMVRRRAQYERKTCPYKVSSQMAICGDS